MSHLVSLTVATKNDDDWKAAFTMLSMVAVPTDGIYSQVTVSCTEMDEEFEVVDDLEEIKEYHDENTMKKAYEALYKYFMSHTKLEPNSELAKQESELIATDILLTLQNAGMLFREIKK